MSGFFKIKLRTSDVRLLICNTSIVFMFVHFHQISNQQQQFPIRSSPIFVFVLFSVSLVLFRFAEVDYWDKPCAAIFSLVLQLLVE